MKNKAWQADELEISVDGKVFFVYANFNWQKKAVDYQFDRAANQGRDMFADVPFEVSEIEVHAEMHGDAVEISLLKDIREITLETYKTAGHGMKNIFWGDWL